MNSSLKESSEMQTSHGDYYLIAACSYAPGVGRWIRTIPKLGLAAKPVVCMYEPHFDLPEGFQVVKEYRSFPGHDRKYLPLVPFVEERPGDWFLVTDVWDVVFQCPILPFCDSGKRIVVSSEKILYQDAPYWRPYLRGPFECLKKIPIWNAGIYAMRGDVLAGCWRKIEELSGSVDNVVDQLAFCLYVLEIGSYLSCDDLLLNLYDRLSEVDIRGSKFYSSSTGKLYSVVHANGSTLKVLDAVVPV